MAAYPAFSMLLESVATLIDGREVARATNGKTRIRVRYPSAKARLEVVHELPQADKATLDAFYAANRAADDIAVTWGDGTVYADCFFAAPPEAVPVAADRYRVRVQLEQS